MQNVFLMAQVVLECLFQHSLETTTPVGFATERLIGNQRLAKTFFNSNEDPGDHFVCVLPLFASTDICSKRDFQFYVCGVYQIQITFGTLGCVEADFMGHLMC